MKNKHLLTEIENINRLIGYDRSKPVLEQSENLSQKVKRIMTTFGKCTGGLPYDVRQGVKTDDNDTQILNKISKNIYEGISFLLYEKSNWGSDNRYIDRSVGEKPFKELIKDFERGYNITIPYNRKAANQEPWSPPKNTPKLPDGSPNYYVFLMRYLGSTDICEFFETYKKIPEETKSNRILKSIINLSDTDKKELAGILSWLAIPAAFIPGVGPILSAVISLSAAGLYMSEGEIGTAAMETFFAVVPFLKVGKLLGPVIKGIPPKQVGKFFNMLAKGEKYSKIVGEVGEANAKKIINKLVKDGDRIIEEISKSMSTKTFNKFKNLVGKSYEDAIREMPSLKDIGKEGYEKLMKLVAHSNVKTLDRFKLMIFNAKKIVLGVTKFTVLIGTGLTLREFVDKYFNKLPESEKNDLITNLGNITSNTDYGPTLDTDESLRIFQIAVEYLVESQGNNNVPEWDDINITENEYNDINQLTNEDFDKVFNWWGTVTDQNIVANRLSDSNYQPKPWNKLVETLPKK